MKINRVLAGISALSIATSMLSLMPVSAFNGGMLFPVEETLDLNAIGFDGKGITDYNSIILSTSTNTEGELSSTLVATDGVELDTNKLFLGVVDLSEKISVEFSGDDITTLVLDEYVKDGLKHTATAYFYNSDERFISEGTELLSLSYTLDESLLTGLPESYHEIDFEAFGYTFTVPYSHNEIEGLFFTGVGRVTGDPYVDGLPVQQFDKVQRIYKLGVYADPISAFTQLDRTHSYSYTYIAHEDEDGTVYVALRIQERDALDRGVDFGKLWYNSEDVDVEVVDLFGMPATDMGYAGTLVESELFTDGLRFYTANKTDFQYDDTPLVVKMTPKAGVDSFEFVIAGHGIKANKGSFESFYLDEFDKSRAPSYDEEGIQVLSVLTENGGATHKDTYMDDAIEYKILTTSNNRVKITATAKKDFPIAVDEPYYLGSFVIPNNVASLDNSWFADEVYAFADIDSTDKYIPYGDFEIIPDRELVYTMGNSTAVPAGTLLWETEIYPAMPETGYPFILAGYDNYVKANDPLGPSEFIVYNAGHSNDWASAYAIYLMNIGESPLDGVVFNKRVDGIVAQNEIAYTNSLKYNYKLHANGVFEITGIVTNPIKLAEDMPAELGKLMVNKDYHIDFEYDKKLLDLNSTAFNEVMYPYAEDAIVFHCKPVQNVISTTDNLFTITFTPREIYTNEAVFDFFGTHVKIVRTGTQEEGYSYSLETLTTTNPNEFTLPAYTDTVKVPDFTFVAGDANLDGTTNILDVIKLNKVIFGKDIITGDGLKNADSNRDGIPDATDSLNIMKMIVHLIDETQFFN